MKDQLPPQVQATPPQTETGPQQGTLQSNSAATQDLGLDAPATEKPPTIELYGFRGVRSIDDQPAKDLPEEDPRKVEMNRVIAQNYLLFAGHIGVSVDGGSKIYGLTPQVPEGMDLAQAKDILHSHAATFPGRVADDKPVFDLADKYHREQAWNTKVISVQRQATPDEAAELGEQLEEMAAMQPGEHGIFYSFPNEEAQGGQWFGDKPLVGDPNQVIPAEQQANCATFPGMVGVPLPEASGNLRNYMPAMQQEIAQGNGGTGLYGG